MAFRTRIRRVRFKAGGELRVLHRPPAHHENEAISLIEETLRELRDGSAIAVGIVLVRKNGNVATAWDGADNCHHQLSSGAARLANRLASEQD